MDFEDEHQPKQKHVLEEENDLPENIEDIFEEDCSLQEEQDWVDYWTVLSQILSEIKNYANERGLPICELFTVTDLHDLVENNL